MGAAYCADGNCESHHCPALVPRESVTRSPLVSPKSQLRLPSALAVPAGTTRASVALGLMR